MVVKYKQDNGLSVILEPIDGVVSVSVGLWIKVGSRDEEADQYGYAHFVEHMLFKGTERYSAKDIARIIDRVGGQHNAATNREYTCYYINVVSDHLELAIDVLADMYYNSLFDVSELEKEKNVIMEEIRMYEDTPDEFIHDLFMESMLIDHPLSHSILGSLSSIQETTKGSLTDFFNARYNNENAFFVIAGNFNIDRARGLVSRYFSNKNGVGYRMREVVPQSPKRLYYKHIERDLEQVHFCLGTEGIKKDDEDRWALYAMSTILGGSMSSRLFQNIREKEGISYSIYSFHSSYSDNGVYGIYCATSPDNYRRAIELIMQECRDIINNSITEEELQDARDFMKGSLALSLESVEVRMGQLAKDEISYGRSYSFLEMVDLINGINHENFQRVCRRIFSGKRLSLVSVGQLPDSRSDEIDLTI